MVAESAFGVSGYRFVFDPTRPGSVHARDAVNDVLQRAAGRTDPVATTDLAVTEPGSRYIDFLVPGLIGMGLMAGGIWGVGFAIVDMRIRQVLKRFLGTPMKKSHFVAAMMFSRMVFMIPEIIIVLLVSLISALRHVMQEGASVLQILPELSLITIWGAVTFVVAIRVFAGNACLYDIQPAIAFTAAEEFARANADKILIGHAAVAAFTEVIFNSCQGTGTVGDPQATVGRQSFTGWNDFFCDGYLRLQFLQSFSQTRSVCIHFRS